MRQVFGNRNVSSRPYLDGSAPDLVSPSAPSYLVNVHLPHDHNMSLDSRQRSEDLDSFQLPAFTLTDAPEQAPLPTRFATVTPIVENRRRPRRLSLPPLSMFARSRTSGPKVRWATSASTTGLVSPGEASLQERPTLPLNYVFSTGDFVQDPFRRGSRASLVSSSELRRALDRVLNDNGYSGPLVQGG